MPKVLHIGPCDTPGGMANVMRTLAEYPPEGWEADLLSSHTVGSPWAKWKAYRRARKELIRRCRSAEERPDVVHLHTAADWSWRRKARFLSYAQKQNMACVVHVHSGKFDSWLGLPSSNRSNSLRKQLSHSRTQAIVLSPDWKERLESKLGPLISVSNPLHPNITQNVDERDDCHLVLLGRNDPVKGHAFAEKVAIFLKTNHPSLRLTMSGVETSSKDWIDARGWVTEEEKHKLLQKATVLLLPSAHEGQPMVVIEALASGLPVIASSHLTSLPDEVIRSGPSVLEWAETISDLIRVPKKVSFDSSEYDIGQVSNRWDECYASLMAS